MSATSSPVLLPQSQVENLFGVMDIKGVMLDDNACRYKILAFGGVEGVLEAVAMGRLLNEIALQLEMPITWLDRWAEDNISGGDLARAYRLGAETLVAKSILVLSMNVDNSYEAAHAKALSDKMTKLAEQLDSQRWGTKRADGLAGQNVSITMNLGGGKAVTATAEVEDAEIVVDMPDTTNLTTRRIDPISLSCTLPQGESYD